MSTLDQNRIDDRDPQPALRAPACRPAVELAAVALATVLVYWLAVAIDLHERLERLTALQEHWQADELAFALLALSIGLGIFAWRRWRDAQAELATRRRAEQGLSELATRHRELAHRVIDLQEAERRHLAREVHDHLGQTCCAIQVEAAALLETEIQPATRAGLQRVATAADALHSAWRDVLSALRPQGLDEGGLPGALLALVESWEERTGIACLFYPDGDFDRLDPAIALAMYRIVQESLSNVARHARATRVIVRLQHRGRSDDLRLRIEDDGVGIRPDRDACAARRGLGLIGMGERARMVGGRIETRNAAARGFVVDCRVPLASR